MYRIIETSLSAHIAKLLSRYYPLESMDIILITVLIMNLMFVIAIAVNMRYYDADNLHYYRSEDANVSLLFYGFHVMVKLVDSALFIFYVSPGNAHYKLCLYVSIYMLLAALLRPIGGARELKRYRYAKKRRYLVIGFFAVASMEFTRETEAPWDAFWILGEYLHMVIFIPELRLDFKTSDRCYDYYYKIAIFCYKILYILDWTFHVYPFRFLAATVQVLISLQFSYNIPEGVNYENEIEEPETIVD